MPTHRQKPSGRIGPASGPKNRELLDRRSNVRWRSGWPNSKSGSNLRIRALANRPPAVGVLVVWHASFRWRPRHERSALVRRLPSSSLRSNLGTGAVVGEAAAAGRRPPSNPSRISPRGQIARPSRRVSPEHRGRPGRIPGPARPASGPLPQVGSSEKRVVSSHTDGAAAVAVGAGVAGRKDRRGRRGRRGRRDRSQQTEIRLPPERGFRRNPTGIELAIEALALSSDFSLFERHVDALYRSALRLTRKPEDAEDLVQETYLRAYRYRNRFKPGTNEKAWLFTIMTNVFRNRLRQRPAPEDPIDQPGADFSIYEEMRREGMPVHLMSPEEIIVERGFGDEVKHALEELPLSMRMVVVLVDVEDFSYKEVASILDIKIGTVMSRLHRGRQALQKKLWEYSGRPKPGRMAAVAAT